MASSTSKPELTPTDTTTTKLCTIPASPNSGPPQVISIGLWRMGTASMASAYNLLGLRPHHALDLTNSPEQWKLFEAAADGTWPDPATDKLTRPPFTREEWDGIYGSYGAITELGSAFAEQLILAYPEAKVVICRRDFEKWYPSFRQGIIVPMASLKLQVAIHLASTLLGRRGGQAMLKTVRGFFGGAKTLEEFDANARQVYDEYFARIDRLVPAERKLHYSLGEGWGPLCEFLGKPLPRRETVVEVEGGETKNVVGGVVEFPHINEAEALKEQQRQAMERVFNMAWKAVRPWLIAGVGVAVAAGWVRFAGTGAGNWTRIGEGLFSSFSSSTS